MVYAHELPAVLCSLLHGSEVPLDKLTEAAEEASHGRLGRQWNTDEHCPCLTPIGAALQAAHKDLGKVDFSAPEGLVAGLGCAITRPGTVNSSIKPAKPLGQVCLGIHQSVMLPTSARVAQEVYGPLIGIQCPMLCTHKNGRWQIGTGSIRESEAYPTGLRFVHWMHHDSREAARADPPPESTWAVYLQIEAWPPVTEEEQDNILVLTTRKEKAFAASATSPVATPTLKQRSKLQEPLQSTALSCMASPAFSAATPTGQTSTKNVTPGPMSPLVEPRTSLYWRVRSTCMALRAPPK